MHRSKGLEFPIVYLPEAWDRHADGSDEGRILRLHEPTATSSGECVLDVGGRPVQDGPSASRRYRAEEAGEDLRLLYVALTRAQCQVVTWWAPSATPRPRHCTALHLGSPAIPPEHPRRPIRCAAIPFPARELGPGFERRGDGLT